MKKTRKPVVLLVILAMLACMCSGITAISFASTSSVAGEKQYFVRTDGDEEEFVAADSSALGAANDGELLRPFSDTGEGIGSGGANTILFGKNSHAVYEFDLDDSVTKATLSVVGGSFTVSHKADGEDTYTDFAAYSAPMKFGFNTISLSANDALKNANNKFKIKIANNTAGQISLFLVTVNAEDYKIGSNINLSNKTLNLMPYVLSSSNCGAYFANSGDSGIVYMKSNGAITYSFNIDSEAMPKVTLNATLGFGGATGANPKWEYSVDGTTFNNYVSGTEIETATNDIIYVKVTNGEGADLGFSGFSINKVMEAGKDLTEIYERANNSETEALFLKQSDKAIIFGDDENNIMGGAGFATDESIPVRLVSPTGYLVYEFDLDNDITEAYFNYISTGFKVEYSVDNDTNFTTFAPLDGGDSAVDSNYKARSVKLTTSDALSKATRRFRIKLTNPLSTGADACLYNFGVFAPSAAEKIQLTNTTLTKSGMSYLVKASGNTLLYVDGHDAEKAFALLQKEAEIIYRFKIDNTKVQKAAISIGGGGAVGSWSYSTNGTDYTAGTATNTATVDMTGKDTVYIKVKNTAESGDLLLRNISILSDETVAQGVNTNPNIPANQTESYFKVGSADEEKHMFGTGADYKASFGSTHVGMVKDGHEGGWANNMGNNARQLNAGQFIAYDFDLKDDITSAKIKVHAGTDIKFKISTDNGATVKVIEPTAKPGGRGMYILELSEADALSTPDNKFRLALQANGLSYVFAVMVHENVQGVVTEGVSFAPWSQGGLRFLEDTNNVHSYYGHTMYQNYCFRGEDSFAIFKVKFDSAITDPVLYVTQCGNVKLEISGDGVTYTTLINNLLGGTGTVPYNTFNAKSYLGTNATIWVKISAGATDGYVADVGFTSAKANEISGNVSMNSLEKYLYSVSNNSDKTGTMMSNNFGTALEPVKTLTFSGETVFKLDLVDTATAVKLTTKGLSGQGSIFVSKNGTDFTQIGVLRVGSANFIDYDVCKDNSNNTVYVKIKSEAGETAYNAFEIFEFTTEGLPAEGDKTKPYEDGSIDFDYDKTLPGVDELNKPYLERTEVSDGKVTFNLALCLGLSIGLGGGALLIGAGILTVLLVKKSKRSK